MCLVTQTARHVRRRHGGLAGVVLVVGAGAGPLTRLASHQRGRPLLPGLLLGPHLGIGPGHQRQEAGVDIGSYGVPHIWAASCESTITGLLTSPMRCRLAANRCRAAHPARQEKPLASAA